MLKDAMPRRLPPGCIDDTDRHGNVRVYYRPTKQSRKKRILGTPWTQEFMENLDAAKGVKPKATFSPKIGVRPDTWGWLCAKYVAECAEFKLLDPRTRRVRKQRLDEICMEPIAPGSDRTFKDFPLSKMSADEIEILRDRKIDKPEAANDRVKAARQVCLWGKAKKHIKTNFARDVPYFKSKTGGYHTWTVEQVRQYFDRHPIGTKAHLALALLLFTIQRRSDIVRFGRQHETMAIIPGESAPIRSLAFTQFKGRNSRKPKHMIIPILRPLQKVIAASPCGDLTYLINDLGRPFTAAGFGNKMRQWCDEAGLPQCSAHGVRKAGAVIATMNGATTKQLMAMGGWDSIKQVEKYTLMADQARLAGGSMHLLVI